MNSDDLRKVVEAADDKFSIFADREELVKYKFNVSQLISLITDFLPDKQKIKLFDLSHFQKLDKYVKKSIIETVKDNNLKLEIINKDGILDGMDEYQIVDIVKSFDDNVKIQILRNEEFINKHKISNYQLNQLVVSLSDESKKSILEDKDLIKNKLNLQSYMITNIVKKFENEEFKLQMIETLEFYDYEIVDILKTFSNERKASILLEDKYKFKDFNTTDLISSMDMKSLTEFLSNNKEFLTKKNIAPYSIIKKLNNEMQMEFVSKFENIGLTMGEKRQILATLNKEVKEGIDKSDMPIEYTSALDTQLNENGRVIVDYEKDMEKYRDLAPLIDINGMQVTDEQRKKVLELCTICPDIKILDDIGLTRSTSKEFVEAEKWISEMLDGLSPEWSDIQKVAYIDNKVGKKISYTPDFDTEDCDVANARALWKIISSGYGVCNGIAQIEKYILGRAGIEAQMISGRNHAFLKLKNIEVPLANGGTLKGDTVLDPTWNLTAQRYGARPENFCRSYEEIRKGDITASGQDKECHKNDEELASATLDLDEANLRSVYTSIGIADKDGNFPIKDLIDKSKDIDDANYPEEESIKQQFMLLQKEHPDFATCQNSTSAILQGILLANDNLKFNKCVVDRVYDKSDEDKQAFLYVYVDFPESGRKFYYADKEGQEFVKMPQKEFEERFECYQEDMDKRGGQRPWEVAVKEEIETDLTRTSGKVVASGEMEER